MLDKLVTVTEISAGHNLVLVGFINPMPIGRGRQNRDEPETSDNYTGDRQSIAAHDGWNEMQDWLPLQTRTAIAV